MKVWIKKDGTNKLIEKGETEKYINSGWSLGIFRDGRVGGEIRKRRWINNGILTKNAFETEIEHYLSTGWKLGRAK